MGIGALAGCVGRDVFGEWQSDSGRRAGRRCGFTTRSCQGAKGVSSWWERGEECGLCLHAQTRNRHGKERLTLCMVAGIIGVVLSRLRIHGSTKLCISLHEKTLDIWAPAPEPTGEPMN